MDDLIEGSEKGRKKKFNPKPHKHTRREDIQHPGKDTYGKDVRILRGEAVDKDIDDWMKPGKAQSVSDTVYRKKPQARRVSDTMPIKNIAGGAEKPKQNHPKPFKGLGSLSRKTPEPDRF